MRGFALNVSGLGGTAEEQAGAEKFVAYLATKGFKNVRYVIDTGRSGINRPKHQNANAPYNSCNNCCNRSSTYSQRWKAKMPKN